MNYKEADEYLKAGRNPDYRRVRGRASYMHRHDECISVRYHDTDVITWQPNGTIILNTDGWKTVTTKARINEYLPKGWTLYQESSVWYLARGGWDSKERYAFADNMGIRLDGSVFGEGLDPRIQERIKKKVLKYYKGYIKALFAGDVPAPSNGDCWDCLMRVGQGNIKYGVLHEDGSTTGATVMGPGSKGKTLGEHKAELHGTYLEQYQRWHRLDALARLRGEVEPPRPESHIINHINDKYYVPSMILRAIELFPVSRVAMWVLGAIWYENENPDDFMVDVARRQLGRSLKVFLYRQLGFAS